jgi:hypothetical protein
MSSLAFRPPVVAGRISWFIKMIKSLALSLLLVQEASGHGHLYTPRSRNWVAHQDGFDTGMSSSGVPQKEYCPDVSVWMLVLLDTSFCEYRFTFRDDTVSQHQ